jgi:hypothetical protein
MITVRITVQDDDGADRDDALLGFAIVHSGHPTLQHCMVLCASPIL